MESDSTAPKIIRPIPRRPFSVKVSSPTPPEDQDATDSPAPRPQISASDLRFLAPHQRSIPPSTEGSTPLSHTSSYLNLTAPPLLGIYSPTTTDAFFGRDGDDPCQNPYFASRGDALLAGTDTPIDTPQPQPGLDDRVYQLMRRRAASFSQAAPPTGAVCGPRFTTANPTCSPREEASRKGWWEAAPQLAVRAALLFALGVGYGVLVTRLPPQYGGHRLAAAARVGARPDWRHLAFWGAAGVALGSLLPWFDRLWEERAAAQARARTWAGGGDGGVFGRGAAGSMKEERSGRGEEEAPVMEKPSVAVAPRVDWALVVRGIGAFVGIVFAIRKLAWASTMQLSLTLALANPILWYLIDRSKPGFLLSAAVGLAGSLAVAVPAAWSGGAHPAPAPAPLPLQSPSPSPSSLSSASNGDHHAAAGYSNSSHGACPAAAAGLCGLAGQEIIETSIWMLSVLFCSCVCFGNIGRRLALSSAAGGRGRWGAVR